MNGIAILGALPGSPAEECGLKYGDMLLSINGEAMSTLDDFLRARANAQDSMALLVRRGGHVMELSIKLNRTNPPRRISPAEAIQSIQYLRLMPSVPEQGLPN